MLSFKPDFSHSFFNLIQRLFSFTSLSAIRIWPLEYLRLLIFLLATLTPACASSSLAFPMMYSAYQLNKQSNIIHTAFTNLEPVCYFMCSYNCCFLSCIQVLQEKPDHWSEWPSSKNPQTTCAGEGVEKREPSCTPGRNVN